MTVLPLTLQEDLEVLSVNVVESLGLQEIGSRHY